MCLGSKHIVKSVRVGNDIVKPATVVRDLGVLLDSELSLKKNTLVKVNFAIYIADRKATTCI